MEQLELAVALGLEPPDDPGDEWIGTQDGARVGMIARSVGPIPARDQNLTFFAEHELSLRCGLLARERRLVTPFPRGLHRVADIALGDAGLDLSFRARAIEDGVARAILRQSRGPVLGLSPAGELAIDDRRTWLVRVGLVDHDTGAAILRSLAEVSRALAYARIGERGRSDAAIGPAWSELAGEQGLAWDPDRATISGTRRDAAIELRVDGEPGLLYTELHLEWPSLGIGLAIERERPRGALGPAVPREDVGALVAAFNREHRVRAERREALEEGVSTAAMHGALAIGALGASLSIDDTGLVARVDRVLDDRAEAGAMLRGAIATAGLLADDPSRGAYR